MPEIKRSDRKNRDLVRKWFRSRQGQESLKEAVDQGVMMDPQGRPINVMLPEAEVFTLGNKDRDLSKDVLRGIGYFGRNAIGMLPFVGEALDVAEASKVAATGEDFFGEEQDPMLFGGVTAASLLIPNMIEGPIKVLKNAGVTKLDDLQDLFLRGQKSEHFSNETYEAAKQVMEVEDRAKGLAHAIMETLPGRKKIQVFNEGTPTPSYTGGGPIAPDSPFYSDKIYSDPAMAFRNFIIANDPSILSRFDPKKGITPELEVELTRMARQFGDAYTQSLRGVRAVDEESAGWYLKSAKGGLGHRALGDGVYSTDRFGIAKSYAEPRSHELAAGGKGYIGRIRSGDVPTGDYKDIITDLTNREMLGAAGSSDIAKKTHALDAWRDDNALGFKSTQDVRVTMEPNDAALDIARMSSDPVLSKASRTQPVTILDMTPVILDDIGAVTGVVSRDALTIPGGGWHSQGATNARNLGNISRAEMWRKFGFDYRYGGKAKFAR